MTGYIPTYDGKDLYKRISYEVGKTYTFYGILPDGFGFFRNLEDLLFHADKKSQNYKVYQIQVLGELHDRGITYVTNKFKLIKEVDISKIVTYDKYGNMVYYEHMGLYWEKEFDKGGNILHFRDRDSDEKYEYDEKGNWILYVSKSNGKRYEERRKYDGNGNCISLITSNGEEYNNEYGYDQNNRIIYQKYSTGSEVFLTYNEMGKCTFTTYKDKNGLFEISEEYDGNGNRIHYKDNRGYEQWYKYDKDGNWIGYRNNNGSSWTIAIE